MRTLSADWMANTSKQENELQMQSSQHGEENKGSYLYPRPVAPTAAQVCLLSATFTSNIHFICGNPGNPLFICFIFVNERRRLIVDE